MALSIPQKRTFHQTRGNLFFFFSLASFISLFLSAIMTGISGIVLGNPGGSGLALPAFCLYFFLSIPIAGLELLRSVLKWQRWLFRLVHFVLSSILFLSAMAIAGATGISTLSLASPSVFWALFAIHLLFYSVIYGLVLLSALLFRRIPQNASFSLQVGITAANLITLLLLIFYSAYSALNGISMIGVHLLQLLPITFFSLLFTCLATFSSRWHIVLRASTLLVVFLIGFFLTLIVSDRNQLLPITQTSEKITVTAIAALLFLLIAIPILIRLEIAKKQKKQKQKQDSEPYQELFH